ncbi:MAG TPA: 3'(2'),5'-bisphosphate nucleotidase CysQ [Tenuifilaceae bacterium]|nr:3'(2'),5'-bisphosphate nucleotidase CysQ [Tenuifilaceae bacterium]
MIEKDEILNLLLAAVNASIRAGALIMEVYNSNDFQVNLKSDKTPLTLADRLAHDSIKNDLSKTFIPVLSEEGRNIVYEERKGWEYFWIVDPLDGTKEFIKRNGEFTVNIALIQNKYPLLGVVYVPVTGELYFSFTPEGAYKVSNLVATKEARFTYSELVSIAKKIPFDNDRKNVVTVESRSHTSEETLEYIECLKEKFNDIESISRGSSLKMCMIAEGNADIYPRLSLSSEWDTAAGQAIVEGAGYQVYTYETKERMAYNKEELLNPWFIVKGKVNL